MYYKYIIIPLLIIILIIYSHKESFKILENNITPTLIKHTQRPHLVYTDSLQNIDPAYLLEPEKFCAIESNKWKRPCPNYWTFNRA